MDENRGTSAEGRPTSVHDAIVSLSNRDHSIDSVTFCPVLRISLLVCGRVCIHAPFQLPFAPSPRFIRRRTTETSLCKQAGQKAERHRAVPGNISLATARLQKFCRNYALCIYFLENEQIVSPRRLRGARNTRNATCEENSPRGETQDWPAT